MASAMVANDRTASEVAGVSSKSNWKKVSHGLNSVSSSFTHTLPPQSGFQEPTGSKS